jgi:hypothetical protein
MTGFSLVCRKRYLALRIMPLSSETEENEQKEWPKGVTDSAYEDS